MSPVHADMGALSFLCSGALNDFLTGIVVLPVHYLHLVVLHIITAVTLWSQSSSAVKESHQGPEVYSKIQYLNIQ